MNGKTCHFCTETEHLESHHVVPQRYDGSDSEENLVEVCPTCHRKLESLYNKRFYEALGVSSDGGSDMPPCEFCGSQSDGQTAFLYAQPPYSVFRCESCAEERGWS